MQRLAQTIWRESPKLVDMTIAELAYQGGMAKSAPQTTSQLRLWMSGADCLGWGWFFPAAHLRVRGSPTSSFASNRDLRLVRCGSASWYGHRVAVREADAEALALVRARGFVADPDHIWMRLNHLDLDALPGADVSPPRGFRLRSVADYDGDITKRVDVHQRSWADLGTRVSLETYPGVMGTWPYRSDLDFVLEAEDGTPAAFALGWLDDQNKVGEFEPVGTDPQFRGHGLGRAILILAMERFREAGATEMIVGSRGDAGHPVPSKLYQSAGFNQLSRQNWFVRHSE